MKKGDPGCPESPFSCPVGRLRPCSARPRVAGTRELPLKAGITRDPSCCFLTTPPAEVFPLPSPFSAAEYDPRLRLRCPWPFSPLPRQWPSQVSTARRLKVTSSAQQPLSAPVIAICPIRSSISKVFASSFLVMTCRHHHLLMTRRFFH